MLNTSVNLSEIIIQTEDTSLASQINICILFSKAKALLFVPLSLKLSLSCSLSFVGEKITHKAIIAIAKLQDQR